MDRIKVALVDSDLKWLDVMSDIIRQCSDMYVVWSAANQQEAVQLARAGTADVILMDISPVEDCVAGIGIEVVQEINKISHAKIIIFTYGFNEELIRESFTAGAVNFLSKADAGRLPEAIRTIYRGASVMEILARDYQRLKTFEYKEKLFSILSGAEKEVIDLYILGYKRKDIATRLGKTEDTIKNQVSSSYKKLNIGRRKELIEKMKIG